MNKVVDAIHKAVSQTRQLKYLVQSGCCSHVFQLHWDEYRQYVESVDVLYPVWLEIFHGRNPSVMSSFARETAYDIGYMIYRIRELLESEVMKAFLPVGDLYHLLDALDEVYLSELEVLTPDAVPDFYCVLLNLS